LTASARRGGLVKSLSLASAEKLELAAVFMRLRPFLIETETQCQYGIVLNPIRKALGDRLLRDFTKNLPSALPTEFPLVSHTKLRQNQKAAAFRSPDQGLDS